MALGGYPVLPVYESWLRLNRSDHEALFTETGYHEKLAHVEVSPARHLVPAFQQFTNKVLIDSSVTALAGHDCGPLVPHVCFPPLNALLPVTLATSSCQWPVTASRRTHQGRELCTFMFGSVPYLYCDDSKKRGQEEPIAPDRSRRQAAAASIKENIPGIGRIMIPVGGWTTILTLTPMDFLCAAGKVVCAATLDAGWRWVRSGKPNASRHVTPFKRRGSIPRGKVCDAAMNYMGEKLVEKAGRDLLKGAILSQELGAPFKLAKLDKNGQVRIFGHETNVWQLQKEYRDRVAAHEQRREEERWRRRALEPIELLPEDEVPEKEGSTDEEPYEFWVDPSQQEEHAGSSEAQPEPDPYGPNAELLDEFLKGLPYAL